jgi:hypothetical protein
MLISGHERRSAFKSDQILSCRSKIYPVIDVGPSFARTEDLLLTEE